jgi:hypothetical protein
MSSSKLVLYTVLALAAATQHAAAQAEKTLPSRGGDVRAIAGPYGSTLGPFSSLKPDCTLIAAATVRIVDAPTHGRLRVYQGRGQPAFAEGSGFTQCNGRRVPGTMVSYDSKRGHAGTDAFKLEIVFANGERRPLAVRLDNRAVKRTKR